MSCYLNQKTWGMEVDSGVEEMQDFCTVSQLAQITSPMASPELDTQERLNWIKLYLIALDTARADGQNTAGAAWDAV